MPPKAQAPVLLPPARGEMCAWCVQTQKPAVAVAGDYAYCDRHLRLIQPDPKGRSRPLTPKPPRE